MAPHFKANTFSFQIILKVVQSPPRKTVKLVSQSKFDHLLQNRPPEVNQ